MISKDLKRILLVDDEAFTLDILRIALPASHYEVSYVNSAPEALVSVFDEQPDLVILDDIKRYLAALQKRLEKLPSDPARDRLQMLEFQKAQDAYTQLLGKFSGKLIPPEVAAIRWMLEELKVSLHAQQLGTPYPISSKRIIQAVQEFK